MCFVIIFKYINQIQDRRVLGSGPSGAPREGPGLPVHGVLFEGSQVAFPSDLGSLSARFSGGSGDKNLTKLFEMLYGVPHRFLVEFCS